MTQPPDTVLTDDAVPAEAPDPVLAALKRQRELAHGTAVEHLALGIGAMLLITFVAHSIVMLLLWLLGLGSWYWPLWPVALIAVPALLMVGHAQHALDGLAAMNPQMAKLRDVLIWGPARIQRGLAKGRQHVAAIDHPRLVSAAMLVHDLLAKDANMELKDLRKIEDYDEYTLTAIILWLKDLEWLDQSKDGQRVWLRSEIRQRFR